MMGASLARNEKLAALFYRLRLIEAYGTCISKIVASYKDSNLEPIFENVEGAFRVILPNKNANWDSYSTKTFKIDEKYLPIMSLFREKIEISRKDVEETLKIGSTQAINIINKMTGKEMIAKVGKGKNARYKDIT